MATYHQILIDSFEERRKKNPAYSVRAFARDIGLAPSHLYDVLSLRSGLSLKSARQIAEKLSADVDRELFIDLVESKHGRSSAARANAKRRLSMRQGSTDYVEMPPDHLSFLNQWYCPAILEVITLKKNATVAYCADCLGITTEQAESALETLVKLNMVVFKDGKFERNVENQKMQSSEPAPVLRNFHKQLAQLCIDRIDIVPMADRKFSSAVMSFDTSRMAEARAFLDDLHDEFLKRFSDGTGDNAVYILTNNFMCVGEVGEREPQS